MDVSSPDKFDQLIIGKSLSSSELKIKDEDWPHKMIWRFVEIDRRQFSLLQFIQFEFVSTNITHRLISSGVDFVDLIDASIWLSMGRQFVESVSVDRSSCRFILKRKSFSPIGDELGAII
jgi:hypothetical protein